MSLLSLTARPLLSWVFVTGGVNSLRHAETVAEVAGPVLERIRSAVPGLPPDDVRLVRLNAAVHIVAGSMLATGRMPRLAAAVLAASMVPTSFAGHAWWTYSDPQQRRTQRLQFQKNAAILGGLLLAAADRGGRPSLAWRTKRAVRHLPGRLPELPDLPRP